MQAWHADFLHHAVLNTKKHLHKNVRADATLFLSSSGLTNIALRVKVSTIYSLLIDVR